MPVHILTPAVVPVAGTRPKLIEEFFGHIKSGDSAVSIARLRSPEDWLEPGQQPKVDKYTIVLSGTLHVETREGHVVVRAGEAIVARKRHLGPLQYAGTGRR